MSFDLKHTQQPLSELSPQYKKLNRLIEKIEQQKQDLLLWQNAQQDIQSYIYQKLVPLYADLHAIWFEQMQVLWQHLQSPAFSKADTLQIDSKLMKLTQTLKKSKNLKTSQMDLVTEITDFYVQHMAHSQNKKKKKAVSELPQYFSEQTSQFEDVDGTGLDEAEQIEESQNEATLNYTNHHKFSQNQSRQSQFSRSQSSQNQSSLNIEWNDEQWSGEKYQQQREEHQRKRLALKREQAEKQAEQSLKVVYLKITAMIHPDREPDEIKKQEKTELFQVVSQAYEQQDLFYLLKLQLQLETNKGISAKALTDEHLKFYKMVLEAQSQKLASQHDEITDALHWSDQPKAKNMQIKDVYKVIDRDVVDLKEQLKWEKERLSYIAKQKGLEQLLAQMAL
ncbi:MAG: molecular chaperone DnaJ [Candidatus Acinetobacter avistercoris]|uniref:molecular chaperone DnaJ n=1 Tax=Acinetobacter sp. KS-LM10 TaxID=3120518 RepID=UPI001FA2B630|nr:molecular chaperone DnaJ [Candidatus Acinetobacter avistercoris]